MVQTLKDYYRANVDDITGTMCAWPKAYYGVFSKVIEENQFKRVAEVGIGYGAHARYVLMNNPNIDHLYLIDPMKYYPNDAFSTGVVERQGSMGDNFEEMYCLIQAELNPWKDKYTWFRQPSITITEDQIPNGSLDCVFVDGNHEYKYVTDDLKFWWQKIRPGGHMLGDDYFMKDVARAAHEFAQANHVQLDLLSLPGSDHKLFRFKKHA